MSNQLRLFVGLKMFPYAGVPLERKNHSGGSCVKNKKMGKHL